MKTRYRTAVGFGNSRRFELHPESNRRPVECPSQSFDHRPGAVVDVARPNVSRARGIGQRVDAINDVRELIAASCNMDSIPANLPGGKRNASARYGVMRSTRS